MRRTVESSSAKTWKAAKNSALLMIKVCFDLLAPLFGHFGLLRGKRLNPGCPVPAAHGSCFMLSSLEAETDRCWSLESFKNILRLSARPLLPRAYAAHPNSGDKCHPARSSTAASGHPSHRTISATSARFLLEKPSISKHTAWDYPDVESERCRPENSQAHQRADMLIVCANIMGKWKAPSFSIARYFLSRRLARGVGFEGEGGLVVREL